MTHLYKTGDSYGKVLHAVLGRNISGVPDLTPEWILSEESESIEINGVGSLESILVDWFILG